MTTDTSIDETQFEKTVATQAAVARAQIALDEAQQDLEAMGSSRPTDGPGRGRKLLRAAIVLGVLAAIGVVIRRTVVSDG